MAINPKKDWKVPLGDSARVKSGHLKLVDIKNKTSTKKEDTLGGETPEQWQKRKRENELAEQARLEKLKSDLGYKQMRKPRKTKVIAQYDKTPGPVTTLDKKEIDQMNATQLKQRAQKLLPEFKKASTGMVVIEKILFAIMGIEVFHGMMGTDRFTAQSITDFYNDKVKGEEVLYKNISPQMSGMFRLLGTETDQYGTKGLGIIGREKIGNTNGVQYFVIDKKAMNSKTSTEWREAFNKASCLYVANRKKKQQEDEIKTTEKEKAAQAAAAKKQEKKEKDLTKRIKEIKKGLAEAPTKELVEEAQSLHIHIPEEILAAVNQNPETDNVPDEPSKDVAPLDVDDFGIMNVREVPLSGTARVKPLIKVKMSVEINADTPEEFAEAMRKYTSVFKAVG